MTAQQGLFNIHQVRVIFREGKNGVASVKYEHLSKSFVTAHKQTVTTFIFLSENH